MCGMRGVNANLYTETMMGLEQNAKRALARGYYSYGTPYLWGKRRVSLRHGVFEELSGSVTEKSPKFLSTVF